MKKILCLGLACLGWNYSAPAQDKAAAPAVPVFQIGVADGDYREFALAGNYQAYLKTFPRDVDFVVGQSDPKRDWPWSMSEPRVIRHDVSGGVFRAFAQENGDSVSVG